MISLKSVNNLNKEYTKLVEKSENFCNEQQTNIGVIDKRFRNIKFTCQNCGRARALKYYVLIRTNWYRDDMPDGYWVTGEDQILCINCLTLNRFLSVEAKKVLATINKDKYFWTTIHHYPQTNYNQEHLRQSYTFEEKVFSLEYLPFVNL